MRDLLEKYGDSWILVAAALLVAGVLPVAVGPGPGRALLVVSLALLLATAAGFVAGRLMAGRRRPTVFLTPRRRAATTLVFFAALIVLPGLGLWRGRRSPAEPIPPAVTTVMKEMPSWTTRDPSKQEQEQRRAAAQLNAALAERRKTDAETAAKGGSDADKAKQEMDAIDRYFDEIQRRLREGQPQGGNTPATSDQTASSGPPAQSLPPPPPISNRNQGGSRDPLNDLIDTALGPFGGLLRSLLGLAGVSGYRTQVEVAVSAMAGKHAPSEAQLVGLLETVQHDAALRREVQTRLDRVAGRMLPPDELALFHSRLAAAAAQFRNAVAEQVLIRLENDPRTSKEELLSYLDGSPKSFASTQQKAALQAALRGRYEEIWQRVFAPIPVRESGVQGGKP